MAQTIASITLVVADYDEAITYYTDVLGFELMEYSARDNGKRWVRVAPPGSNGISILLARAVNERQRSRVGNQTGGRVGFFLHTDDFHRDYAGMRARGVVFSETPREEAYGTVAVFEDLYGNRWDLLEPKS